MKKFLLMILMMSLVFMLGCSSAPSSEAASTNEATEEAKGVSGTFEGEAQGMGGPVKVTITLEDGVLTDVKAVGDDETPGIGTPVLETLPGEILKNQSLEVEAISGATITSDAVIEATKAALAEAGVELGK